MNVFDKIGDIKNNVRQNSFDWTHDNNFTTEIGRITPIFCDRVPPKSSLRIKPTFGLQFMPMMFPIQTKLKAYLSFYRVPLRTLWKDYQDFISSPNEESTLEAPYYAPSDGDYSAGKTMSISGLADYLGVPLTGTFNFAPLGSSVTYDTASREFVLSSGSAPGEIVKGNSYKTSDFVAPASSAGGRRMIIGIPLETAYVLPASYFPAGVKVNDNVNLDLNLTLEFYMGRSTDSQTGFALIREFGQILYAATPYSGTAGPSLTISSTDSNLGIYNMSDLPFQDVGTTNELRNLYTLVTPMNVRVTVISGSTVTVAPTRGLYFVAPASTTIWNSTAAGSTKANKIWTANSGNVSNAIDALRSPYVGATRNPNGLKLSAYPFRAYEAVYNAYIRNIKNNPFVLNGKPVYNRWITNDEGGKDTTSYSLFYANWASDAYTTALPSPQQGKAPLVGITTYTETVALENGHEETALKFAMVDEDGKKYGVKFESNGEELKGVEYTNLSDDTPVRAIDNLYNLVTSGISINDFRNVNAYQRYLELNQFRGFSYKDIIEGRFDVNVRYDALQMPEYIGGFTRDVSVNPITQTVETSDSGSYVGALGSQAGLALLRGESDATISCFCDEESIVIGLLSVVPMPVYTQVLPKHFLYRERLDSFNPEFDHIGYQPIYQSELAPIEYFAKNGSSGIKTAVFGYQRPWYEYCQKIDTAHGLFRTQLRNFLMNRVFSGIPELGRDFTTVDPEQVNDVFSVTETTDKILGQIHLDITAKLPISRVVVPKLE